MKQLMLNTTIYKYDDCKAFCREFRIGKGDLIITNKRVYGNYLKSNVNEAAVLFEENYGKSEASDKVIEAMYENIKRISYDRVIAIGERAIMDIGKLFALKHICPVIDLYNNKIEIVKEKELILVPATCGTGSEVTNISILELKKRNTKLFLITDELYADNAVMIPELLRCLPFDVLINNSIESFIISIETYLSTKATAYTRIFSMKAIEIIINGYRKVIKEGKDSIYEILEDLLLASNYSGIAFVNAGGVVVQAISYPVIAMQKLSEGQANLIIFTEVFKLYEKVKPNGEIKELNKYLSFILECDEDRVCEEMKDLLNNFIDKKPVKEYEPSEVELKKITSDVMEVHERLMANNYVNLNYKQVYNIFKSIYNIDVI